MTEPLGFDPYEAQTRVDVARLTRTRGKPNLDLTSRDQPPLDRPAPPPAGEDEAA